MRSRLGLVLTLSVSVALVAALVNADRELHLLNVRLALGLNSRNTVVQGQPSGCVLFEIPHVDLAPLRVDELMAAADRPPEEFLLAVAATRGHVMRVP